MTLYEKDKTVIYPGKGINDLIIKKSTLKEIIDIYGNDYEYTKHSDSSIEVFYKTGIKFNFFVLGSETILEKIIVYPILGAEINGKVFDENFTLKDAEDVHIKYPEFIIGDEKMGIAIFNGIRYFLGFDTVGERMIPGNQEDYDYESVDFDNPGYDTYQLSEQINVEALEVFYSDDYSSSLRNEKYEHPDKVARSFTPIDDLEEESDDLPF